MLDGFTLNFPPVSPFSFQRPRPKESELSLLGDDFVEKVENEVLGIFLGEFPKIALQIVPLTQEKNFFVLQVQLYEEFSKSQVKKGLEETVSHIDEENKNEKASKDNPHVFQVSIDFILTAIQRLFYSFNCEFDHGH